MGLTFQPPQQLHVNDPVWRQYSAAEREAVLRWLEQFGVVDSHWVRGYQVQGDQLRVRFLHLNDVGLPHLHDLCPDCSHYRGLPDCTWRGLTFGFSDVCEYEELK